MTAPQFKEVIAEIKPRFPLIAFNDIKLSTAPRYLVREVLPSSGLAVVWGPPKHGKSFWTFDIMMHVALGWDYRGHRVQQGTVVYSALEGQQGFEGRAEAFRMRFLPEAPAYIPFYLMPARLSLVEDCQEFVAAIKRQTGATPPAAVVLDTLNRSFLGSESSDEDMTAYVRAADAIISEFGCLVTIVHHSGLDTTRMRGHSSLKGAEDAEISVKKDTSDMITATVTELKDGPSGATFTSRLEQNIVVGIDSNGEEIKSCVILAAEGSESTETKRLTGQSRIAFDLLCRAITEVGEHPPASNYINRDIRAVTKETWRRYFYSGAFEDSDTPETKRQAFNRAAKNLQSIKKIGVWEDWVWIV